MPESPLPGPDRGTPPVGAADTGTLSTHAGTAPLAYAPVPAVAGLMPTATSPRVAARVATAAAVGHIVEYYDFAVYALLAPVFAHIFFPSQDHVAALLSTFAVFGVSYVVRPLGGIVFGHLADKAGRRVTLAVVILLMSCATTAVGLLPSHQSIGVAAPVLLVVCRCLQGLSTGGEYGGSASFVAESAPPGRRGFYTSWIMASTAIGLTLGAVVGVLITSVVPRDVITGWGWRIPFLIALPLGIVGLYVRLKLDESPEFTALSRSARIRKVPVVDAIRLYHRSIVHIFGLVLLLTVSFYVVFVYLTTYLNAFVGVPLTRALPASIAAFVFLFALTPVFGRLSDRIGRKRVLMAGAIAEIVVAYPAFLLFRQGSFGAIALAYAVLGASHATYLGPLTAALTEQFPPELRAAGLGIGYNLPVSVFGGLAPLVLTYLISTTHVAMMPAFYIIGSAAVTLAAVLTLKEPAPTDLATRRADQPE